MKKELIDKSTWSSSKKTDKTFISELFVTRIKLIKRYTQ